MRLLNIRGIHGISLLALASVLSGCASMGGGEDQAGKIRITSDPAGAIVYADGSELGAAPLQITPGSHFRSGFAGFSYRYIGKLSIKKPGCETWSTEVNDFVLSKDIHAKLKCDPGYTAAAVLPAGGASNAGAPKGDQTIERLERIESLHKRGLISDEEYKQSRARIIEKL